MSGPNIIKYLRNSFWFDNEKLLCVSNSIPKPEFLYLSRSVVLVKLTAANKEFGTILSNVRVKSTQSV